jgi:hypothetical protein
MTEQEMKSWVDNADYEQLLRKWRFAPVGDPLLQGDMGDYFSKVMFAKRDEVGNAVHVATSKHIGWDNE